MRPKKIAIVSSIIGAYDLKVYEEFEYSRYKYDFILFTNMKKLKSDIWDINYVDEIMIPHNISKSAYYYKWNLHNILDKDKYDYVVWVDSSISKFNMKNFDKFIDLFKQSNDALWIEKHPSSKTLKAELNLNVRLNKDDKDVMINQVNAYYSEGYVDKQDSCVETGFSLRKLNDDGLNKFCDYIWNELKEEGKTKRDQLVYDYCLYKTKFNNYKLFTFQEKIQIIQFRNHPNRVNYKKKLLLAGPFFGDPKLEMAWAEYVREHTQSIPYDSVVVGCRPNREFLYEDYADKFLISDPRGTIQKNLLNGKVPRFEIKTDGTKDIIQLNPKSDICENFKIHDRSESKIHLLWCTIRPEMFKKTYADWMEKCVNKDRIVSHIAVDTERQKVEIGNHDYVQVINNRRQGVTYPSYVLSSKLKANDNDIVIFASDDFYPMDKWDDVLFKEFETYDGNILVNDKYDDSRPNRNFIAIPIMTFSTLKKLNKVIYHPDYIHCWSDNELYDNLIELKLLKDISTLKPEICFEHRHFSNGMRKTDDIDRYHQTTNSVDMQKYFERKKLTLKQKSEVNRVISFSLWGDGAKYTKGAIENVKLQKEIYPNWVCRFYYDDTVPQDVLNELEILGAELVLKNKSDGCNGLSWRFEVGFDETVDRFIIRDTDSRLNLKEKYAVDEWMNSEKSFHIMRDHKNHGVTILGGMWGATKGFISNFKELYDGWIAAMPATTHARDTYFNFDQIFLWQTVWPRIKDNHIAHDEIFKFTDNEKPFPFKLEDNLFIGQSYTEDNKPIFDY